MSEINAQISASGDDSYQDFDASIDINSATRNVDTTAKWFGLQFKGIDLPSSASISVAYLTIQYWHSAFDESWVVIGAEDSASPSALTTSASDVSSRTRTSNTITWQDSTNPGSNVDVQSDDFADVIQELIDSYGEYSSDTICILVQGYDDTGNYDAGWKLYADNPTYAPKLHIEYTAAGPTALTATEITNGAWIIDSPTLLLNPLISTGIVNTDWLVDSPTFQQNHDLTATDITIGSWIVDTPTLTGGAYQFVDGYGGDVNTAEDVLLNSNYPHLHMGDHNNLHLTVNPAGLQKGILRFDISSIPSDATCVSAKLYLYHGWEPEGSVPDANVYIYSLTSANSDWVEFDETTDPGPNGSCTWDGKVEDGSGNVTTAWAGSAGIETSGTDYEATAISGPIVMNANNAIGYEYICALDTDRIAGWFGASNTNYTIGIWSSDNWAGHVASSDHATTAYRPRLVILYTTGDDYSLLATEITGNSWSIDSSTLGQVHDLTASEITGSDWIIDSPTLIQNHDLTATDITNQDWIIDSPVFSETAILVVDEIINQDWIIDSPTIDQVHSLIATDVINNSWIIDSPDFSSSSGYSLNATDIIVDAWIIDSPSINQDHQIASTDITGDTWIIDSPAFEITTPLNATDIVLSNWLIDSPAIGSSHVIIATDIYGDNWIIDSPTLNQLQILTSTDIVNADWTVDTPALSIVTGLELIHAYVLSGEISSVLSILGDINTTSIAVNGEFDTSVALKGNVD